MKISIIPQNYNKIGVIKMHIWTLENWKQYYNEDHEVRSGLRLRFDKDVDPEVRRACKEFCKWLRTEYYFPIRVTIYIKSAEIIKALDGDMVYYTFFEPFNRYDEPYARIATGYYKKDLIKYGKDNTLASILAAIAGELTHYYQWINDIKLTEIGENRQATKYADWILDEYAETREHP